MNSLVRRKYCMRCNREIYTTWRTLDETKYYHPQCFTCADCGVILESIQDHGHGVATQEDIYCKRCHNDRFAPLETDQDYRKPPSGSQRTSATGNSRHKGQMKTRSSYVDNVDVLFSSPYTKIRETSKTRTNDENKKGGLVRSDLNQGKNKVGGKKRIKANSSVLLEDALRAYALPDNDYNYNFGPQKSSRIPRPTSAGSKKSLTITTAATSSTIASRSKTVKSLVSKSKNSFASAKTPPSPGGGGRSSSVSGAQKMQRSISLMQAKSPGVNGGYHLVPPTNKSHHRTGSLRPRSAMSSRDDKSSTVSQRADTQFVKSSSSIIKRHCAASFTPKKKRENSKVDNRQHGEVGGNGFTVQKNYSMGGAIPSTQAILSAIKREGSDLFNLKSSCQIPSLNTDSYDILPAKDIPRVNNNLSGHRYPNYQKRSSFNFNMTFECPICISSLVPTTSSTEKGCLEGRSPMLGNVVTPCGHLFHLACMDNWLKIKGNKRCPICSALCLPETLQPVYLECNLCADLNTKSSTSSTERNGFIYYRDRGESKTNSALDKCFSSPGKNVEDSDSFKTLRSQYELLKSKYNEIIATNNSGILNAAIANSLQNAYDVECRNRLQLQWENRKLMMKIEELKMAMAPQQDDDPASSPKLNSYDILTA